jgi:hypothetical protein
MLQSLLHKFSQSAENFFFTLFTAVKGTCVDKWIVEDVPDFHCELNIEYNPLFGYIYTCTVRAILELW